MGFLLDHGGNLDPFSDLCGCQPSVFFGHSGPSAASETALWMPPRQKQFPGAQLSHQEMFPWVSVLFLGGGGGWEGTAPGLAGRRQPAGVGWPLGPTPPPWGGPTCSAAGCLLPLQVDFEGSKQAGSSWVLQQRAGEE